MDFLIDVHLPISLSKFLNNKTGCKAIHVNQILQKWHTTDAGICRYADDNGLVVITKDSDFKNFHFINKTPKRVIRVSLGNISNAELNLFDKYLAAITALEEYHEFYIEMAKDQLLMTE